MTVNAESKITRSGTVRVGADIGGTFTDLVMVDEQGRVVRRKVPSTVDDYSQGIIRALGQAMDEAGTPPADIAEVVHGTTVATNAVLELKGAKVGMITTAGFRDVLELRRLRMPNLYRLDWQKPKTLVERYLRKEVAGRIAADGSVVTPLDLDGVRKAAAELVAEGVEAIAVMFINSYVNASHEAEAAKLLRELHPDVPISASVEILPEMQEYERASTTVVNAYVQPVVQNYVRSLRHTLDGNGVVSPLLIMQSNGGIIGAETASKLPVRIIESGPAAGVVACQRLAELADYPDVICFDMGGTTAKASLIENGQVYQATEYEVGGGVSSGSRLNRGGGYVIRVASLDIAEVGAGGGSLVSFDMAGGVQVGPHSAGSFPGPVAYGNGNTTPTVTDANLTLGYINPNALAGGSMTIDSSASREAVKAVVGDRLGLSTEEAAFGVHTIANANMIRALRSVTIERGRDPNNFVLFAFGGSGPIHAAHIARELEIRKVVVPPSPGLFSAFGLLLANIEHHYSLGHRALLGGMTPEDLAAAFAPVEAEARRNAEDPSYPLKDYELRLSADLRYVGQTTALTIALPAGPITADTIQSLRAQFGTEYQKAYGFSSDEEDLEFVVLRVVAAAGAGVLNSWLEEAARAENDFLLTATSRRAYFGPDHGFFEAPVLSRAQIAKEPRQGPAIVEAYDSTIVIPPDATFHQDRVGNIVIDFGEA
jgi:N-methylhydantoinase A